MADEYKICDICKDKTNCTVDVLFFGDWQICRDVVVHYFCLLLSTNLPQRGKDSSGINGFLLRDIRKEVTAASKRLCCYCGRAQASIQCYKCNEFFHIRCGRQNRCLFTFKGDFRSYCDECIPRKDLQPAGLTGRPSSFERCSICRDQMGLYDEVIFIFGKCCNKGYAHNVCVQKYALAAGYYLSCLWCRSEKFRDTVRQHGIFVPDRDARWEIQKETYKDLHRGHSTCNMETCLCPKGRDFNKGKWSIILCSLCGSFGAHNPVCLLGKEKAKVPLSTFKCRICTNIEGKVTNKDEQEGNVRIDEDRIDKSIFMTKNMVEKENEKETSTQRFPPTFSEDDDAYSSDSVVTVITRKKLELTGDTPMSSGKGNKDAEKSVSPLQKDVHNVTTIEITDSSEVNTELDALPDVLEAHAQSKVHELSKEQPVLTNVENENEITDRTIINAEVDGPEKVPSLSRVDESLKDQDIINNLADEETQLFIPSSLESAHKTANTKETLPLVRQLATESIQIIDDETQVFDISSQNNLTEAKELQKNSQSTNKAENVAGASSTSGTSQEFFSLHVTKPMEDTNQSPIVTSSSQPDEDWVTFDVYEYDEMNYKCIGSATMRINLNEARFAGMTLEEIEERSSELLTDADIISRSDDIGIFAQIDAIIASTM